MPSIQACELSSVGMSTKLLQSRMAPFVEALSCRVPRIELLFEGYFVNSEPSPILWIGRTSQSRGQILIEPPLGATRHPDAYRFDPVKLSRMNIHQILEYLKAEISKLDAAITALEGSSPRRGRPAKSASGKRTMSASARANI